MIHQLFTLFNWLGSEWVLVILISLSVVALGVVLQRWFEIQKLSKVSARFWNDRADHWFNTSDANSWRQEVGQIRIDYPCLETDTLEMIYRAEAKKDVDALKMLEAFLEQRKIRLERGVSILGTIGSNAPFIGLLGTVLGIIRAFHTMSVEGSGGGMDTISSGISEALVATAIGLLVAVPAVCFFNLLNKKIGILTRRAQSVGLLALSSHPSNTDRTGR